MPIFFSSTASIIFKREFSTPIAVLRANPILVGDVSACTSSTRGLVPSYTAVTADPSLSLSISSSRVPERFSISTSPDSAISKAPISLVVPNLFFWALNILSSWLLSPAKLRTQSTICSSILGPARSPLFVTWATMNTGMPPVFPILISSFPQARTCETLPGDDSISEVYIVCMESIMRKAGFIRAHISLTLSILVSERIRRSSESSPHTLSALIFICSSDSSPET